MRNLIKKLKVTEGLTVKVLPSLDHEFFIPTVEVAKGYGVANSTLRDHIYKNKTEFLEETHYVRAKDIFVKGVGKSDSLPKGLQPQTMYWTKRGIIRLGFFIKSERAKLFRDWIENLVIEVVEKKVKAKALPANPKRKHNRLSSDRIISIMLDIVRIEDADLRLSLTNKILGGSHE